MATKILKNHPTRSGCSEHPGWPEHRALRTAASPGPAASSPGVTRAWSPRRCSTALRTFWSRTRLALLPGGRSPSPPAGCHSPEETRKLRLHNHPEGRPPTLVGPVAVQGSAGLWDHPCLPLGEAAGVRSWAGGKPRSCGAHRFARSTRGWVPSAGTRQRGSPWDPAPRTLSGGWYQGPAAITSPSAEPCRRSRGPPCPGRWAWPTRWGEAASPGGARSQGGTGAPPRPGALQPASGVTASSSTREPRRRSLPTALDTGSVFTITSDADEERKHAPTGTVPKQPTAPDSVQRHAGHKAAHSDAQGSLEDHCTGTPNHHVPPLNTWSRHLPGAAASQPQAQQVPVRAAEGSAPASVSPGSLLLPKQHPSQGTVHPTWLPPLPTFCPAPPLYLHSACGLGPQHVTHPVTSQGSA